MNDLKEPFDLGLMFPDEIEDLLVELERIADKYTCAHAPCEWELEQSKKKNSDGEKMVVLHANKFMVEAYIREQAV